MNESSGAPIEYPLRLDSTLEEIHLADDVCIRRLDNATRVRTLGIDSVVLDERGRLKSYRSCSLLDPFSQMGPDLDHYDQLYSSNYVVAVATRELAQHINFSLKLLAPSCSSLFIGYESPHAKHFLGAPCYYGSEPLVVGASEASALSELLRLRRRVNDPKLGLMAEMFLYAMSVAPREESRFVELSVILEMLLLPTSSTELSYRFALRMAKVLAKYGEADPAELFKAGQRIYKSRSRLVHSGRDDDLPQIGPAIEDAVRQLLKIYLATPEAFDDDALDRLCIAS